MVEKERFGAIYGLVFGLFLDFASAAVFGVNALSFMIIGFIIGITVYQKIAVSFVGAFFLTSVSTVVSCCIIACAYTFFTSTSIADVFLYICIPKIILTVPTVIVTYPIIKFMGKRFALHEEREGIW
jgi:rod shape-determining protein MreD